MEFLLSTLGSILGESAKYLCGFMYSKLHNVLKFKSNIKALQEEVNKLWDLKESIQHDIELAEEDGRMKTNQVSTWLKKVEELKIQVTSIQTKISDNQEKLYGCCVNCSLCFRLGNQVVKKLKEVKQVQEEGGFEQGVGMVDNRVKVVEQLPVKVVEQLPGPSIVRQRTAAVNLRKVMDFFKGDEYRVIGIWGMGGIGKTTLIKNLNNELGISKGAQLFSIVIWVTVSKDLQYRRIQNQISERLNMAVKLLDTEETLAIRLFNELKRKRFLLILDDIWERVDLDKLGIPRPASHTGSKIVLTTRSREVCGEMNTDKEFKVDVLGDEESWSLFEENAGEVVNLASIKSIAKDVVKECCGLPLAIITVGRAMRRKHQVELWKDALKQLQMSTSVPSIKGLEKEVFLPLKWSYDLLEGNNIKLCFLYCCLYPEDYSIDVKELVQCLLADGLIEEQETLEDSYNRGIALIDNLKNSCLLECGEREGTTVRMHDVVRDLAIWIASSLKHGDISLVALASYYWIPKYRGWKSYKRVSFMNGHIDSLNYILGQCSGVTTLLLQGNSSVRMVSEVLFEGFQALRVLNLSSTSIKMLPHSLGNLTELRALLLSQCKQLQDLPSLQGLKKLRVLDLSFTYIKKMPLGMEYLKRLRELNVSNTNFLESIPVGTISGLPCLEVLDMRRSRYGFDTKPHVTESQAALQELSFLNYLADFSVSLKHIQFENSETFTRRIRSLRRFYISYGIIPYESPFPCSERTLVIEEGDHDRGLNWLLETATGLVLHNGTNCKWWFEVNQVSMSSLRWLTVDHCSWNPSTSNQILPTLEELYFRSVAHENRHLGQFMSLIGSNLRIIKVHKCELDSLLPSSCFHRLQNLVEIEICHCLHITDVLDDFRVGEITTLPNLRIVKLKNLPKLQRVCTRKMTWPCIQEIEVDDCPALVKLPLSVEHDNVIQVIRGELDWWNQLKLEDENSKLRLLEYFLSQQQSHSVIAMTSSWTPTVHPGML